MKKLNLYLFILLTIFSSLSCNRNKKPKINLDNNSYLNNFELIQQNSINSTRIKISGPKAVIDSNNNNIEILDSLFEISNNEGNDISVKAGRSIFNNSNNFLRVDNNVYISLNESKDSFLETKSFDWDLNESFIILKEPLYTYFNNTKIKSYSGIYNIDQGELTITNNELGLSCLTTRKL